MVRLARDEWALFYSLIDKITLKTASKSTKIPSLWIIAILIRKYVHTIKRLELSLALVIIPVFYAFQRGSSSQSVGNPTAAISTVGYLSISLFNLSLNLLFGETVNNKY